MKSDYAKDNELDTLNKEKISLYSQVSYCKNIISNVIYISIRIYYSWKGYLSYQLVCIKEQVAKVWSTLKKDKQLKRDLSASKYKYLCANGGSIVMSNIRNGMNISYNRNNMKWSSQSVNSLRMYVTKTSSEKESSFKVINKTQLTAILINELKAYEQGNIYKNLKGILNDPYFWIAAYNSIKNKPGNMIKGIDDLTLDGISFSYFEKLAKDIISGNYQPNPIRRVEISKANGKSRSLGIISPRDKIIQAGIACILEAIWEPKFLNTSHGFRPNRSRHTALKDLYLAGTKYKWVIQGDITKCLDSIPHNKLIETIRENVKCHLTIALLYKCIRVGIKKDNGTVSTSKIGITQESVLSPVLCNILLHTFDKYLAELQTEFYKGKNRSINPLYAFYQNARTKALKLGNYDIARKYLLLMKTVPNSNPMDTNYRRLKYLRYANDFVILVIGSHSDCIELKTKMKNFLNDKCGLILNESNIKINLLTKYWDFLGITLIKSKRGGLIVPVNVNNKKGLKTIANTRLLLFAPIKKIKEAFVDAKIVTRNKFGELKPHAQTHLINLTHYEILKLYNQKINGILNYYSFVTNRFRLGYIIWCLQISCALTISRKFKINSLPKTFHKFGRNLTDPDTNMKLVLPKDYKVTHHFNINNTKNSNIITNYDGYINENDVFKVIKSKSTDKLI